MTKVRGTVAFCSAEGRTLAERKATFIVFRRLNVTAG